MLFGGHGNYTAEGPTSHHGQCRSRIAAYGVGVFARMIGLPTGTSIWIAAGFTDLRRGFTGLSGMVQTTLQENPFSGHVFVFRGRRGADQDVVVGRRWAASFREAARTWTLHLAASDKWNSVAYTSPVIDVAGRDRLAATGTHANAAAGGVSRNYQQLICHEFSCLAYCAQDE